MKDIYDQYAELKKEYEALRADYQDVLEDSQLLDAIEYWKIEVCPSFGKWINEVWHDVTWKAGKYTFPTEMSGYHPTVRAAVEEMVAKLKRKEAQ